MCCQRVCSTLGRLAGLVIGSLALGSLAWLAGSLVTNSAHADHRLASPARPVAELTFKEEVQKAYDELPGDSALLVAQLNDKGVQTVVSIKGDRPGAVGSSFKLYILGELIDQVNQGQREAENTTVLRKEWYGPPFSEMNQWPVGSPVTLHTLAFKMISLSDNTATDHLMHVLGRDNVEKMVPRMGHSEPSITLPLIYTREMAQLRDKKFPERIKNWVAGTTEQKRAILRQPFAQGVPSYENLDFDTTAYQKAEWFAAPLDMAHALLWIKNNTTDQDQAKELRKILTPVRKRVPYDPKHWKFVGFKGGSEDQVMALNYLMQRSDGSWWAFCGYVNLPDKKVDFPKTAKTFAKIIDAVGRRSAP